MSALGEVDKDSYLLIEFKYGQKGNHTFTRYTDWNLDIVDEFGKTFLSNPGMEVSLPEQVGNLEDSPCSIELPFNDFTDWISSGEPTSPIYVQVWERFIAPVAGTQRIRHFVGRAARYVKNKDGNRKRLSLYCRSWKSVLDVPLSFPVDQQCVWTYGDKNCKAPNYKSSIANGLVTEITGTQIKISGLPSHASDPTKRFWHNGFVEKDGIQIVIRDWHIDTPTVFKLFSAPPASWIGATLKVTPGCDYRVKTCDDRHGNTEHFMGLGIAIPAHAPNMQVPAEGDT